MLVSILENLTTVSNENQSMSRGKEWSKHRGKQVKDSEMRVLATFTTQQGSCSTGPGALVASGRTYLSSWGLGGNVGLLSQRPWIRNLPILGAHTVSVLRQKSANPLKSQRRNTLSFGAHTGSSAGAALASAWSCSVWLVVPTGIWILYNILMSQHTVLLSFFSRLKM